MNFVTTVLACLLIVGCQPSHQPAGAKKSGSPVAPILVVDTSTPDRALKSYWQARDVIQKITADMNAAHYAQIQTVVNKIGFDAKKLMTGDVLSTEQEIDKLRHGSLWEEKYSREILDIRLDTGSRATALVKIRNSTPIPVGIVVSDEDKRRREEGERFKYILEREADGWKVAQVYLFDKYSVRDDGKDPWRNVYSTLTDGGITNYSMVNEFSN
jgi:hypothetical protein